MDMDKSANVLCGFSLLILWMLGALGETQKTLQDKCTLDDCPIMQ
jgi:hypothetical protein